MKYMAKWLLFLLFVPALASAGLFSPALEEGVSYRVITPEQPTVSGEKVEVVELFSYACPHCYHFEPNIERWLKNKPENVKFVRMPVIFRDDWIIFAKAYYAAEALGVLDKIHGPLFKALHAQKRRLGDEASLMAFFAEQGVSNADFKKVFNSFAVDSKVKRSRDLTRRYGINSTPSMVVNGKYRVDGQMAGGLNDRFLQIVDGLIAKK